MKWLKLFIFPCVLLGISAKASTQKEINYDGSDWSYYSQAEVDLISQQNLLANRIGDYKLLIKAKKSIINGNLEMARFYLDKIASPSSELKLIKKRYLAIVHFIKGEYESSYAEIKDSNFNSSSAYPEICILRLINLFALEDKRAFNKEYAGCINNTFSYSNTDQFWLRTMSFVKAEDKDLLTGNLIETMKDIFGDPEYTKIWLKLGIYINKEKTLVKYIKQLPEYSFKSKKIRELIGLIYYRLGDRKKAIQFIEDIESPNADNIRGNIELEKEKYELAFGHFKLALKKKQNSVNALERAIPLAWLLGQWDDGIKLLTRVVKRNQDIRKKIALDTAFKIRKENFTEARAQLNQLELKFKKKTPLDVDLMDSYVALRTADRERLIEISDRACRRFDGLNCWLKLQNIYWENMGETINRDEKVLADRKIDIDTFKSKGEIVPLKETVTIDQKDIEELDSYEIEIVPEKLP